VKEPERASLNQQLTLMMSKAMRSLASAQQQWNSGDYDFASSRAYYAMFYCLEAILLTEGLTFAKHSGVIGAFNRHFVKPGHFPKTFSGLLARLFRERQMADYEFDLSIGAEDARKDIESSQTILQAIKTYLTQQGFLIE
jgi:uncharacterized protein (UPF0332 family)